MEFKERTIPIPGEVEVWKIARLGYILSKLQKNRNPQFNFADLILLLFLSHFKYVDSDFIQQEKVMGNYKRARVYIVLNKLIKMSLVEKIQFNLDSEVTDLFAKRVYKLTKAGLALTAKIHYHLDGTDNFLDY